MRLKVRAIVTSLGSTRYYPGRLHARVVRP